MIADRPFLGILLMLGFCTLAPLGDATAKVLGDDVPVFLLIVVRFGIQAALLVPLCLWLGLSMRLPPRRFALVGLRTVLHIVGIGLMFSALRFLPLADAIAIAFVMPFIMLILGHFILGEQVGPHRMIACAVGFVGTLMVIQPNFVTVGWPALLPLGVAVVFAFFMLVTRLVAKAVDAVALQAVSGLQALFLLMPLQLFWPGAPDAALLWQSSQVMLLLFALGILGTAAHLLMTWSLRFAPSSTLAPMQYLEIPIGTLIGWLVFSNLPNGLAAAGIAVTIAAGLYVIGRERAIAQAAPQTP